MSVFGLAVYGFEWRLTLVQALEFAKQTAEDQPRDGMIFLSTYGVIFWERPIEALTKQAWEFSQQMFTVRYSRVLTPESYDRWSRIQRL